MIIKQIPTSDLKTLVPSACCEPSAELLRSIEQIGLVSPLIINNNTVSDGNRRLAAAKILGIAAVNCLEFPENPSKCYAALNTNREISAYELAAITSNLDNANLSEVLRYARQPESPQFFYCLAYIREKILQEPELLQSPLPINIWRELAHLEDQIMIFAPLLIKLQATVGQKRSIAQLLRQLKRKGNLPAGFEGANGEDALSALQAKSQPRRTSALKKFEQALANADLPKGTQIKTDPTFSQPGLSISICIKRNQLSRLDTLKASVIRIFEQVEEL